MWKAEEQNAVRLAQKSNLVLSGLAALFALTFFMVGKDLASFFGGQWTGWRCTFATMVAIAALVLLSAIWKVMEIHKHWRLRHLARLRWWVSLFSSERQSGTERTASSSDLLDLPPDPSGLVKTPWEVEEHVATWVVYATVLAAARDLHARNEYRKTTIDRAQVCLFIATLLLFLSIVPYTVHALLGSAPCPPPPSPTTPPTLTAPANPAPPPIAIEVSPIIVVPQSQPESTRPSTRRWHDYRR